MQARSGGASPRSRSSRRRGCRRMCGLRSSPFANAGHGLTVVQLKQLPSADAILDFGKLQEAGQQAAAPGGTQQAGQQAAGPGGTQEAGQQAAAPGGAQARAERCELNRFESCGAAARTHGSRPAMNPPQTRRPRWSARARALGCASSRRRDRG